MINKKKILKIALVEPFYIGSHQKWVDEFQKYSNHDISIFQLSGKFWKWRMHGGAINLAQQVMDSDIEFDLFLLSDFMDLSLFKSLISQKYSNSPIGLYFHENQLTYPWSPTDKDPLLKRDQHYLFINYSSALVSDFVLFNSDYHMDSFMTALPRFLKQFPDNNNISTIDVIKKKSSVLYIAIELPFLDNVTKIEHTILWNHRWEYDKNPTLFFNTLKHIKEKGIDFKLIVLGENTSKYPPIFDWAQSYFKEELIHFGYAKSREKYWQLLQKATILPVTSNQDFFGISIVEAMHANVFPLLPNRLSYPEHIPIDFHDVHLFDDDNSFLRRLEVLLTSDEVLDGYDNWVSKYSWKNSIEKYDDTMLKAFLG